VPSRQAQKRALEQTLFALEDAEAELIWRRRLPDVNKAVVDSKLENIRAREANIEARLNALDAATAALPFPDDATIRQLSRGIEALRTAIARSAGANDIITAVDGLVSSIPRRG